MARRKTEQITTVFITSKFGSKFQEEFFHEVLRQTLKAVGMYLNTSHEKNNVRIAVNDELIIEKTPL